MRPAQTGSLSLLQRGQGADELGVETGAAQDGWIKYDEASGSAECTKESVLQIIIGSTMFRTECWVLWDLLPQAQVPHTPLPNPYPFKLC